MMKIRGLTIEITERKVLIWFLCANCDEKEEIGGKSKGTDR
jgi:hypothetical protein